MSLILQQACSEQTNLSTHSSVTSIEVRSSATNSKVQQWEIKIFTICKVSVVISLTVTKLPPILIYFFPLWTSNKAFLNIKFLQDKVCPLLTVIIPGISMAQHTYIYTHVSLDKQIGAYLFSFQIVL